MQGAVVTGACAWAFHGLGEGRRRGEEEWERGGGACFLSLKERSVNDVTSQSNEAELRGYIEASSDEPIDDSTDWTVTTWRLLKLEGNRDENRTSRDES